MVSSFSRAWHLLVVTVGLFIPLPTAAMARAHTSSLGNGGD